MKNSRNLTNVREKGTIAQLKTIDDDMHAWCEEKGEKCQHNWLLSRQIFHFFHFSSLTIPSSFLHFFNPSFPSLFHFFVDRRPISVVKGGRSGGKEEESSILTKISASTNPSIGERMIVSEWLSQSVSQSAKKASKEAFRVSLSYFRHIPSNYTPFAQIDKTALSHPNLSLSLNSTINENQRSTDWLSVSDCARRFLSFLLSFFLSRAPKIASLPYTQLLNQLLIQLNLNEHDSVIGHQREQTAKTAENDHFSILQLLSRIDIFERARPFQSHILIRRKKQNLCH